MNDWRINVKCADTAILQQNDRPNKNKSKKINGCSLPDRG
jgi:hypothetical protein